MAGSAFARTLPAGHHADSQASRVHEQGPHRLELVVATAGIAASVSDGLVIRRQ